MADWHAYHSHLRSYGSMQECVYVSVHTHIYIGDKIIYKCVCVYKNMENEI